MSISDTTETAIMALVFNATAWANYADNAATTPQTQISWALHTADPGDAGTQTTSESAYGSYARINVNRNSGGHTVTGGSVSPVANVDFPSSTGSGTTIGFFSTGKTGGGATAILWSGTVSPTIAVPGSGIIPRLTTASTITLD
jgi:hypothetical protein